VSVVRIISIPFLNQHGEALITLEIERCTFTVSPYNYVGSLWSRFQDWQSNILLDFLGSSFVKAFSPELNRRVRTNGFTLTVFLSKGLGT